MNYVHHSKTVFLLIVLILVIGCKSKQDKPGANTGAPQDKAAAAGAPVASPQDKTDAKAAAARVLEQLTAGDFPAIYREAAPGFKQIGSESQFVAKFQQTRQKTGVLKNPRELTFDTRPDHSNVLTYRLENERFITDVRLTFARSQSGKIELAGLNQHDEPKK